MANNLEETFSKAFFDETICILTKIGLIYVHEGLHWQQFKISLF